MRSRVRWRPWAWNCSAAQACARCAARRAARARGGRRQAEQAGQHGEDRQLHEQDAQHRPVRDRDQQPRARQPRERGDQDRQARRRAATPPQARRRSRPWCAPPRRGWRPRSRALGVRTAPSPTPRRAAAAGRAASAGEPAAAAENPPPPEKPPLDRPRLPRARGHVKQQVEHQPAEPGDITSDDEKGDDQRHRQPAERLSAGSASTRSDGRFSHSEASVVSTVMISSTPRWMPPREIAGLEARRDRVGDDHLRQGIGQRALEPVADLDAHAPLVRRDQQQHAVVLALPRRASKRGTGRWRRARSHSPAARAPWRRRAGCRTCPRVHAAWVPARPASSAG